MNDDRKQIAAMAMQGLLTAMHSSEYGYNLVRAAAKIAGQPPGGLITDLSVEYADRLLARLEKGREK